MSHFVVAVDFSHLFHVCWATAQKAPPQYELIETTIENVVGKLRTVKEELKRQGVVGYDLVFAEDRPATRKLALLPGYRAGREDLSAEKNKVKSYLLQNGSITRFCFSAGNEADDVLASLCRLVLEQEKLHVTVVSGDRDLWQLIQDRVDVYNPVKQQFVTEEDIETAFKCRPIHIPLYKTLWGDYGDCVPNLMPYTKKQLLPIVLKTDGRLETFKVRLQGEDRYYLSRKCYELYTEVLPRLEVNWQLVKLDDHCDLVWE